MTATFEETTETLFARRLAQCAGAVGTRLERELAAFGDEPVARAMRYACTGGKRLRAFFVMESGLLHGVPEDRTLWAAAAVEALHAYSLVHDDLPAMDDDDLRRGQPTVHIKWDEATAVLVGDALQAFAFELLTRPELSADAGVRLELLRGLARAAGAAGMVLGQARDIAAETADRPLNLAEITELQSLKTGALIEWSTVAGPVLGGADAGPMRDYSRAIGLAFQIADDILDVTGDTAQTGKRLGKDAAAGKATFVSLLGLEGAKRRAAELAAEAEAALEPYGAAADALRQAARFVISRQA